MNQESTTTTTNQIILEDNSQFFYSIKPFELTNALGNIVAILQEYIFIKGDDNNQESCYKLYKTKEGNWYEITDIRTSTEYNILRRLKAAMEIQETPLLS